MLKSYARALLNVLLARLCFTCGKKIPRGYLCVQCSDAIAYLWPPLCRYCSKPLKGGPGDICGNCSGKTYPFDRTLSITAYREPMVSLLHLFKYQHYDYLADLFAQMTIAHLERLGQRQYEYDCVVPIPLHRQKLKARGYNQAGLLARALSKYFGIPHRDDIIRSVISRPSQTKLSPHKRTANVCDTFMASAEAAGKNVLLVDDVLTTGATAAACAQALGQKGVRSVTVMTLSKTL